MLTRRWDTRPANTLLSENTWTRPRPFRQFWFTLYPFYAQKRNEATRCRPEKTRKEKVCRVSFQMISQIHVTGGPLPSRGPRLRMYFVSSREQTSTVDAWNGNKCSRCGRQVPCHCLLLDSKDKPVQECIPWSRQTGMEVQSCTTYLSTRKCIHALAQDTRPRHCNRFGTRSVQRIRYHCCALPVPAFSLLHPITNALSPPPKDPHT